MYGVAVIHRIQERGLKSRTDLNNKKQALTGPCRVAQKENSSGKPEVNRQCKQMNWGLCNDTGFCLWWWFTYYQDTLPDMRSQPTALLVLEKKHHSWKSPQVFLHSFSVASRLLMFLWWASAINKLTDLISNLHMVICFADQVSDFHTCWENRKQSFC